MTPVISYVRLALRRLLYRYVTIGVLLLSPTPKEPPLRRFQARRYHEHEADHVVWLGFQRDTSPLPNAFNTVGVIEMPNVWVNVSVMDCDSLVKPCAPPEQYVTPGDYLATFCEYVVEVPCSYAAKPRRTTIIGPISCAVVAKRLIGLHDSSIVTAAELLAALWRDRWQ